MLFHSLERIPPSHFFTFRSDLAISISNKLTHLERRKNLSKTHRPDIVDDSILRTGGVVEWSEARTGRTELSSGCRGDIYLFISHIRYNITRRVPPHRSDLLRSCSHQATTASDLNEESRARPSQSNSWDSYRLSINTLIAQISTKVTSYSKWTRSLHIRPLHNRLAPSHRLLLCRSLVEPETWRHLLKKTVCHMRMDTLASQMGSSIKEETSRLSPMGLLPRLLLPRRVHHRVLAGSYQLCSKSPVNKLHLICRGLMASCLRNIVATVNLDCRLDLKTIALHARNAEYNPKVSMATSI